MAVSLLSRDVSELCIGKPALRPLPAAATVGDALVALKRCGESCLSVWAAAAAVRKVCVGKLCMADVIFYLCSEANIGSPGAALKAPVSVLLPKGGGAVRHVEEQTSIMEGLDLIMDGAQNLIVPIHSGAAAAGRKKPGGAEHCWLTLEDFVRYFLNSIAAFSPLPSLSIAALGLVCPAATVRCRDTALSALPLLRRALADQTSVAVLDDAGRLAGELFPSALARCGESAAAAALAALSAGELAAFVARCSGAPPPEAAARALRLRLVEQSLDGMLDLLERDLASPPFSSCSSSSSSASGSSSSGSSSSSDEEGEERGRRREGRRSEEAVACQAGSSLVAVMVQALAHRVSHVWVVEGADYRLAGVVAFRDVLRVFWDQSNPPTC